MTRAIPKGPLLKQKVDEPIIRLITEKMLNHDYEKRITANMSEKFLNNYYTIFKNRKYRIIGRK